MGNLKIDVQLASARLSENDNFHILTHKNPDGDTFGCAFALWNILHDAGKRATVFCSDGFPERYDFLYRGYTPDADDDKPFVVAVDVADTGLLGSLAEKYGECVDLCIDHHVTNELYARETVVEQTAAACELVYRIWSQMNIPMTENIARCLYTGIVTDSGCFKFSNTTPGTHLIAAELMKLSFGFSEVNRRMFDLKSRSRILLEAHIMKNLEMYAGDTIAINLVSLELVMQLGLKDEELDGVSSLPLQVEGVKVAVTMRERRDGSYKISMRSPDCVDVAQICSQFGGGGHINAAGCEIKGSRDEVCKKIVIALSSAIGK